MRDQSEGGHARQKLWIQVQFGVFQAGCDGFAEHPCYIGLGYRSLGTRIRVLVASTAVGRVG